jgi:hypothetical protein
LPIIKYQSVWFIGKYELNLSSKPSIMRNSVHRHFSLQAYKCRCFMPTVPLIASIPLPPKLLHLCNPLLLTHYVHCFALNFLPSQWILQ